MTQAARGFLQGGVHPGEGGLSGKKHVGKTEKCQSYHSPRKAVDLRQPFYAEGSFQCSLQHASGAKGHYDQECPDVAGYYKGQCGKHGPNSAKGEVRAGDEPGKGDGYEDAGRRNCGYQKGRAKDNLQGAKSEEQLPELRAGADSPDEEIEKGEGNGDGHNCGGAD